MKKRRRKNPSRYRQERRERQRRQKNFAKALERWKQKHPGMSTSMQAADKIDPRIAAAAAFRREHERELERRLSGAGKLIERPLRGGKIVVVDVNGMVVAKQWSKL